MSHDDGDRKDRGVRLNAVLILLLLVLAGRLVHLQVLRGDYWESQSRANRVRPERIKALRGLIHDTDGAVLVTNRPSFSVAVIPSKIKGHPEVTGRLATLLGLTSEQIEATIQQGAANPYDEARVKRDVDLATIARIEESRLEFPGVVVVSEPVREYPFGEMGCHLLGYVGEVTQDEIEKQAADGYRSGDETGRSGIEKSYEQMLRGIDGKRYILEDAVGRQFEEIGEDLAQPGNSLVLTIDWRLQAAADSALSGYPAGVVVALDPWTGGILALASHPGFDPNLFCGGISGTDWARLNQDPSHPLLNRAIQCGYSPGSTFKLVTAGAALEGRVITPGSVFRSCFGGYQFGKRFFGCWESAGHGQLALQEAIVHSCNTYFYQVGERLNLARFAEVGRGCGFGGATGIDLPQEIKGLMPTPEYYDKRLGKSGWGPGVLLNLAIGQGELLTTPLQLAAFYGALGTRGTLFAPHVLDRVETWDGRPVESFRERSRVIPLSPATLQVLREALAQVVERGTGKGSKLPEIAVAGKTGTAQNPHGTEHAWFVAYAPADAPEIVVAVMIEQGGHGGATAAPIAKRIFETHFGETVALDTRAREVPAERVATGVPE